MRLVARHQVGPAESSFNAGYRLYLRAFILPYAEMSAGRILQNCHPANVEDVERGRNYFAAQLAGLFRRLIGVGDRHVQTPMRRRTRCDLLFSQCVGCAGVAALKLKHGIHAFRHGHVVDMPAE